MGMTWNWEEADSGEWYAPHKGMGVPENFLVRPSVPQVEVLEHVDAFVSHGGANSLFESIAAAVPLLILPHFGDQHADGKMVVDLDIGLYHDDPVAEVTVEVLREDVAKLLDPQIASKFKRKMQRLQESIRSAGGARRAVG